MKYLIFSTLLACQLWIADFENRIAPNHDKDWKYDEPRKTTIGYAVVIVPHVEHALIASEVAAIATHPGEIVQD